MGWKPTLRPAGAAANAACAREIGAGTVRILRIETDEEAVIAAAVRAELAG
ncbi:hypothetical protein [Histidinibacterium lentulum]|uniref:hypothetical protein n=1 Tax=Histidinibacterium lentulum TaxID=2480588 RepID=UPI00161A8D96|nr:hypothetical protein [Histidinibacterium lentulum]